MFYRNEKKKTDAKFDSLILRLESALYSTVSYNKNMSFWPACLDRCGQIKNFNVKHCQCSQNQ